MMNKQIVVLGAGPAGAAVALGLKRLGYEVCVVSEWRRFAALEGVSQRVLEGLRQAGLHQALASACAASPRQVRWNGEAHAPNVEHLLDRPAFDAAIRQDLLAAGVELIEARVRELSSTAEGHCLQLDSASGPQTCHADFLVEARGRQAPLSGKGLRGQETLSLLNHWQEQPGPARSAVESLADGWAWMARLGDGRCFWQLTLDVASTDLPEKSQLAEFCAAQRAQSTLVRELFGAPALQPSALHARSSTATLCLQTSGDNWLRVGDAAMAVDPLSGNGIFQSLSSSLQAPAVINTLLQKPERAALARHFHQQRVEQLFLRFARIGRDFYAMEQQWVARPFWQSRRNWPDDLPLHAPADYASLRVARAPVINGELIDEADVVITADQPLGIWHLQGIELAPIVRALHSAPLTEVLAPLAAEQQRLVYGWLRAQGYRQA
ncbi:FAD-dependent oxidoreductase [Pseudomonas cavernicola]|uniref:FAD-dependent oxidoreductase n=1 Tax=Pseudomonas cavernicola TaxID=2320866 RepID=A0A418X9L4_9PSED|nr:FAD-dependent oxidoreductase [Pseudomonas cavernicola]